MCVCGSAPGLKGKKQPPPARRPMWRSDHGGMANPFLVLHKNPSGSRWDGLRSWKLPRTNFDDQARRCGRIPSKPTVSGPNTPGSVFPSPRLPVAGWNFGILCLLLLGKEGNPELTRLKVLAQWLVKEIVRWDRRLLAFSSSQSLAFACETAE
ncbi:uncharacterized protein BO66DRAFT_425886 [Aspergillus aculeatinus CBS 121060]|uniref:Uncharacterized protein n=1 Tax=Aspergillus aculeatinus CBS 121060 TaxID=1448322 RepID=A0ACD1HL93_9EURO|nr:hypothetical protein BO66DRAFT_425886 [Aspergillus aculeatinus CBS 121060]RAH74375.1 hypothetical protein BO66DRAFT_425886 [Aspergillus aculeatinus CBS 121060]